MIIDQLRTQGGRAGLQRMDGTPPTLGVEHCGAIRRLDVLPMPAGSFPTYPLCNVDNKTFRALAHEWPAVSAAGSVVEMDPAFELSGECVDAYFFNDGKKGHAGHIKVRDDVTRLGMGWLDRLYIGIDEQAIGAEDVEVIQGKPLFLLADDRTAVDHALVPWLVTVN